ncbi:hypothetical protein [Escherichia phage OLB35]|uniref:Uncharacterized protein n=1 Tax=Escherichia phage OLB35 TaxID=2448911 RepID=A0A3G3MCS9_9CAUD|nr:hypothetical protein [Escherichia phage OLB35]
MAKAGRPANKAFGSDGYNTRLHWKFNTPLSAEEIFKLYYLKNQHNFERQDNGY